MNARNQLYNNNITIKIDDRKILTQHFEKIHWKNLQTMADYFEISNLSSVDLIAYVLLCSIILNTKYIYD